MSRFRFGFYARAERLRSMGFSQVGTGRTHRRLYSAVDNSLGGYDALAHTDPDRRSGRLRRRLGDLSLCPLIMMDTTSMREDRFKPVPASCFN
jgi:hypothetical protein